MRDIEKDEKQMLSVGPNKHQVMETESQHNLRSLLPFLKKPFH
jgi:hypothetical protein